MKRAPTWTSTVTDTGMTIHAATWKGCHLTVRGRASGSNWKLSVERRSRAGTVREVIYRGSCVELSVAKPRAQFYAENAEGLR